jgi:hypothetical protein
MRGYTRLTARPQHRALSDRSATTPAAPQLDPEHTFDRGSLICFAALQVGAPFGYADWLGLFALAALANMIGGLGLVTLLRLLQIPHKVLAERKIGVNSSRGQTG